jgi:hypothetical protein
MGFADLARVKPHILIGDAVKVRQVQEDIDERRLGVAFALDAVAQPPDGTIFKPVTAEVIVGLRRQVRNVHRITSNCAPSGRALMASVASGLHARACQTRPTLADIPAAAATVC